MQYLSLIDVSLRIVNILRGRVMEFIFLLIAFTFVSFFTFYMIVYLKDMIFSKKLFDENPDLDFVTDNGCAINEKGETVAQKKPVILS